ncbi:hypothetical protein NDU88_004140 [Pleurodeles waltl]|uniref:Uncharacterized protein n=1 Tax=Pleurodeles waltl TaxID=8319 RepID=A0AAV7QHI7_PLEWA|nr:hypothetical protein NDU88_004140 [Pleurodeles waltl]
MVRPGPGGRRSQGEVARPGATVVEPWQEHTPRDGITTLMLSGSYYTHGTPIQTTLPQRQVGRSGARAGDTWPGIAFFSPSPCP